MSIALARRGSRVRIPSAPPKIHGDGEIPELVSGRRIRYPPRLHQKFTAEDCVRAERAAGFVLCQNSVRQFRLSGGADVRSVLRRAPADGCRRHCLFCGSRFSERVHKRVTPASRRFQVLPDFERGWES